jgi:hypothetical protein
MLWSEKSLRELSSGEALGVLRSDAGRDALRGHLPGLLADPAVKGAALALLEELLARDGAEPLAERLIIEGLAAQVDGALRAERAKAETQKTEILDKAAEELRASVAAQKSAETRQVNQHTQRQEEAVAGSLASMKRDVEAALRAARVRFEERTHALEDDVRERLDALLEERVAEFAVAAVRRHQRERPVSGPGHTNRELAALNGISIREVKRRRRAARASDERRLGS